MKEKDAWQTKEYQCINSRVFFLNPAGSSQTFSIEVYHLDYHKMIHWYCFVLLFSLNSIPFHVDLTLEQNTFSVNPFSPRLPFLSLISSAKHLKNNLVRTWIRSVPIRYSLSNMKLALLLVVFLAVILEVRSVGDQEQDSRQIPHKVGLVFFTSLE